MFNATSHPVVIYAGRNWDAWFGGWTGLSDLELVYAHYDQIPSYRDWCVRVFWLAQVLVRPLLFFYCFTNDSVANGRYGQPYGGWKKPAAKQLWDHDDGPAKACGLEIDWEWSDEQWGQGRHQ